MRISFDVIDDFYKSNLGQITTKIITQNTKNLWQNNNGQNILGFGYCSHIFENLNNKDARIINYQICDDIPNKIFGDVLGNEERTPFADDFFDKIMCLHSFEESPNPQKTLRELWRILKPEGSLILIVPNRRGAWARSDETPFGHGRPYSRSQIINILNNSLFDIICAKRILFCPPYNIKLLCNLAQKFEKLGTNLLPTFGGLLFFEIKKRVFIAPPFEFRAKLKKSEAFNASNFSNNN